MDYIITSNRATAEHWRRKAGTPRSSYTILTTVAEIDALDLGPFDWVRYNVPVADDLIDAAERAWSRKQAKAS